MFANLVRSSLLSLGAVSVLSVAPVFFGATPAKAEIVADGELGEYGSDRVQTLAPGAVGPVVRDLQMFLDKAGYYEGTVDGIYGPLTAAAIEEYQEAKDLVADGIVGDNTWGELLDPAPVAAGESNAEEVLDLEPEVGLDQAL